ncbi:MAG: sigma-54 dependent transcriptional regulator [bacterium]|nr:sigma-54 dependent transcriptional regulator [bacterium]
MAKLTELFSEFNVAAERLEGAYKVLQEKVERANLSYGFGPLVGRTEGMKEIYEIIRAVAKSRASVLVYGESGTGKELVSRAIHYESNCKDKPFISINCAAISEGLLESELFGHEKGAFTGALEKRKGKFELANGGTLLLDEISEMGLMLQAKLLRVLQEFRFFRVGGSEEIKVDVRIIATTNLNPKEAIEKQKLREDLFYRLNVVSVNIPPLRERKEDIPVLAAYFLRKYSTFYNKQVNSISTDALKILLNYNWPGNVRELENVIERAVILNSSPSVLTSHLNLSNNSNDVQLNGLIGLSLDEIEKKVIIETLKKNNGNRTNTAKMLKVSIRTIREKIRQYKKDGEIID